MSLQEKTETERLVEERGRYVARGVSTPPLVVARAEGARLWDVDGREYIEVCRRSRSSRPAGARSSARSS